MRAIILAAGQGTRLGNLTASTPKCLVKVGTKSILEWQIKTLNSFGIEDIEVVIGTKGSCWNQVSYDAIKSLCPNIIMNFDNNTTMNGFSLYLGIKPPSEKPSIFIDGDVIFSQAIVELMLVEENIILSRKNEDRSVTGARIITDDLMYISSMGRNILPENSVWYIYSGMGKLNPKAKKSLEAIVLSDTTQAEDIGYYLNILSKKVKLKNVPIEKGWINVNTPEDLLRAELLVEE